MEVDILSFFSLQTSDTFTVATKYAVGYRNRHSFLNVKCVFKKGDAYINISTLYDHYMDN